MGSDLYELDASSQYIEASFKLKHSRNLNHSFALNIDFKIPSHGVTAIFGESGSGKTTLLRCIAGLVKADLGSLTINDEVWQGDNYNLATHKRSLGYVFQEPSLFEHLTVMGNLSYGIKRSNKKSNEQLFEQVITVMGIYGLLNQMAGSLSGGEKQRVAIARALLAQPKLLLMDEPLASLDVKRKLEILPYIETLRDSFDIPVLYVTHSVDEIARLADHILVIKNGEVINRGGVSEVFSNVDIPLGSIDDIGVILECDVVEINEQWHLMKVQFDSGELWLPKFKNDRSHFRCRVRVLASDVSISLNSHSDSSILNQVYAKIIEIKPELEGATALVKVKVGHSTLLARITNKSISQLQLSNGKHVWVHVKSAAIVR